MSEVKNGRSPRRRQSASLSILAAMWSASDGALAASLPVDLGGYVGSWAGAGTISGEESGTVLCRMDIVQGDAGRVTYSARCATAGQMLSLVGAMLYDSSTGRYEAALTSGTGGFSGTATGEVSADGLAFTLKQGAEDQNGLYALLTTTLKLSDDTVTLHYDATFEDDTSIISDVTMLRQ